MRYTALQEGYADSDLSRHEPSSLRSSTPSGAVGTKGADQRDGDPGETPSWRRTGRFSGLIVTTIASATLLSLYPEDWKAHGKLPTWISAHQATTQLIVQAIAGVLGMIQTSAICELINVVVRNRLRVRPMRLNTLHFWISIAQDRMDWDVQSRLLFPLAAFCLLTVVPAALWAGAMAPVVTDKQLHSNVGIPGWKSFPSADTLSPDVYTLGDQKRTSKGLFSYSVGMNQYGHLAAAAAAATSPDDSQITRQKPDGTQYVFLGRSYGAGAMVGFENYTSAAANISAYHYLETGYYPHVSCIYNNSAAYILEPQDPDITTGYSWWRAVGVMPNSNMKPPARNMMYKRQNANQTLASTLPGGDSRSSSSTIAVDSTISTFATLNGNTTFASTLPNQDTPSSGTLTTGSSLGTTAVLSSSDSLSSPATDTIVSRTASPADTVALASASSASTQTSLLTLSASSGVTSGSGTFDVATSDTSQASRRPSSSEEDASISSGDQVTNQHSTSDATPTTAVVGDPTHGQSRHSNALGSNTPDVTASQSGTSASPSQSIAAADSTADGLLLQESDPFVGIYGSDYLVSFGTPSTPPLTSARYLALAAGENYNFLNRVQCKIEFEPTVFRVSVGVHNRSISVEALMDRPATDINASGDLQFMTMRKFTAVAHQSSGLDMNLFGESLRTNIGNQKSAQGLAVPAGGNYSRSDDNLPGIKASVEAMVDDILLGFGGAQAMVGGSADQAPAIFSVPAVSFGQAGYIVTVLILNAIVVLLVVAQALVTRFWSQLPAFDCLDPISIVLASSKGGSGLGHLADSADVGEMRVSLLQTEKRTEPLTCWQHVGRSKAKSATALTCYDGNALSLLRISVNSSSGA